MKREPEAKSGPIRAKAARAIILTILLCVSGTAARAQKKSGPSSHSSKFRSSTTTTVTPPSITAQPASVTVLAGGTASFSVAAAGTAPLSYQWYENGMAIGGATSSTCTISAATTSYNGAQFTATVSNSGGTATSNAALLTVNSATLLLNSSSKSLAFGYVNVSSSSSQSVTLTNAGNSSVTISNVSVTGAGFNAGGGLSGVILSPGQTATLSATFAPATAGSVTGGITVTSNASNSPAVIALSGTGVAPVTHSVLLSWAPSTSSVTGYNVYSSEISGGPYSKLTASPVGATSYTDGSVAAAQTYYYVVTAVSSTSGESAYSPQVSATVP
ncbi:MAG TPA: immunoglobulin domain-containing protein [Candidatus Acidoferrales bacterium]|nr:immunoglobulin domain-containing protein [Candidatus Acidoferrales bacterium]